MKKLGNENRAGAGNSPSISLVVPKEMFDKITDEAWRLRMTKSELIRHFIVEGLRR